MKLNSQRSWSRQRRGRTRGRENQFWRTGRLNKKMPPPKMLLRTP
jgi:hypothetical protein